MSFNRYQYEIICEDMRQHHFIKKILEIKGAHSRRIRLYSKYPEGQGAGAKFVDDTFEEAMQSFASIHPKTILVIVRDIDKSEYGVVKKQLDRGGNNVFAVLPKRNIESWFYYLDHINEVIDEEKDYKLSKRNVQPTAYAKAFCQLLGNPPANLPSSLAENINRLQDRIALK